VSKYKIVDLFSGVGGLSYGFSKLKDFEIIMANEIEQDIAKAYSLNHPNVNMINCDISKLTKDMIKETIKDNIIDVVVGGPPCQSYSTLGKRQMDDRANLFKQYKRVLNIIKPKAFVFENVTGILSMDKGNLFKNVQKEFEELGYQLKHKILNAVDYGVPQQRERVILVGFLNNNNFEYPSPTHGEGLTPYLTLKDALGDLPVLDSGQTNNEYATQANNDFLKFVRMNGTTVLDEHSSPKNGEHLIKIMQTLKDGQSKDDLPEEIRPKSGYGNTYAKLWWNRPSTTITRNFACPSSSRCIHPRDSRAMSIREGARLQSFPDNYKFYGSDGMKRLEIGNAVPPLLSIEIAKAMLKALDERMYSIMYDKYISPLSERYAGTKMQYIFSPEKKFKTWRRLWIALAKSEKKLGLDISDEQIAELEAFKDDINYEEAKEREKIVRHDVMSHVYAYGLQCPKAKKIIHLGATSCYVGDNTDLILMREALELVRIKLVNVMEKLSKFAMEYKDLPTLAFTHFQPAQPTTVGKRAVLWLNELLLDYEDLNYTIDNIKLLGCKGTTGTQASFVELFSGDEEKIKSLDKLIAVEMGFDEVYPVSGQTYSRKIDSKVLGVLAGIAQSAHKFSNDIRLLQHLKEIEEPFEKNQIGSSAMAYKRNPMRSERIASLANYVMSDLMNPMLVASTQWFERTLDDSANKRLSVPEGFLSIDGILDLYLNVVDGLVVYPKVIEKRLMSELPFMATENILMEAVKHGGDRQELHERIRELSMEAGKRVKVEGKDNNLLELIAADKTFNLSEDKLKEAMDPKLYIGRSSEQVVEFVNEYIAPILEKFSAYLGEKPDIKV